MMAADSGAADPDEDDTRLRPAWEDTPDETDADRGRPRRQPGTASPTADSEDLRAFLTPLCDATDALARLDARASGADDALREGLIARPAYAEAAGCLPSSGLSTGCAGGTFGQPRP